jgi:RNA polymerase sigma-70 factor, ECF subfamily
MEDLTFHELDAFPSVERLRNQEEAAWREVYERFENRLTRYFVRKGVRFDEAEDLRQDVLGKVFRRIDAVRDPERFDAWVLAIARNHLRSRLRRNRVEPDFVEDADVFDVAARHADLLAAEDLRRVVQRELADMSPSARRLLQLRILDAKTSEEAREILGLSAAQQRRKLHLALSELRRRLAARSTTPTYA